MNKKASGRPLFALTLALLGVIFFSSKSIMVKLAYGYNVDAISMLALRMLFSAPVYIVVLLSSLKSEQLKKQKRSDYLKLLVLGVLGYYVASMLDFAGLKYLSAGMERLILFVYPTLVLILSAIFFKKRPTLSQKIAVVTTYFGVMIALFHNNDTNVLHMWKGSIFIFGSALTYAAYLVGSGSLLPKFGTKIFTSLAMIISMLAVSIHFYIVHGTQLFDFPREIYFLGFAMAMICTVIPSFLISEAINQWGASNVAIVGSIGPISTILLAGIFLGEKITIFQVLGTVIVISGVLLLSTKQKTNIETDTNQVNKM
jgi:drug/metabolite transporter (DMT)-like permease